MVAEAHQRRSMCGIVGLFFKARTASPALGPLLAGMLREMAERGPDSTGFAVYGDDAPLAGRREHICRGNGGA